MRLWAGASSGIFLSEIKIFSDLIDKWCLSAAFSAHGNILPGRNRPQELSSRTWRTAIMWKNCDASIYLSRFIEQILSLIYRPRRLWRNCMEACNSGECLENNQSIYWDLAAFGFAIHVKTCPIRGEHLELFARKAPTKEFLSLQCLAALWQVKSSPLLLPVPEQPQAGDSAVCKMGRFFRQPELFAGSSEYPDPCQGHPLLLVLLQSLQSWVLIDYCLQSRKRRDCNCQTELINLKAQVDESMLHIITLS